MAQSRHDLQLAGRAGGATLLCWQPLLLLACCPQLSIPSAFLEWGIGLDLGSLPHTHTPSCLRSYIVPCVVYSKRSWGFAVVSAGINHWCFQAGSWTESIPLITELLRWEPM